MLPSRLRLSSPSPGDLDRWQRLTELRKLTRPEAADADTKAPRAHSPPSGDVNAPGAAPTTTAFLRWRVLPAGPWEFSRTFPLRFPRPADWGRDPSGAGEPGMRVQSRNFTKTSGKRTRKARARAVLLLPLFDILLSPRNDPFPSKHGAPRALSRRSVGFRIRWQEPPTSQAGLASTLRWTRRSTPSPGKKITFHPVPPPILDKTTAGWPWNR